METRKMWYTSNVISTVTVITMVAIPIATYLTDKDEHTALYKINENVHAEN